MANLCKKEFIGRIFGAEGWQGRDTKLTENWKDQIRD